MILITGITGKTGGEVARQLSAADVPFRALVRNPEKAQALRPHGAELVMGDVGDPVALKRALAGVSKALLVMPNGEHQLELESAFTDAAVAAGLKHLVKLSSLESVPESRNPITRMHVASEAHIRASGLAWTMIRPTFFTQTFLAQAQRIRDRGEISMPVGKGTLAPTDLRDVAEIIVACLTQPGHEKQSYDLTGPELITMDEVAARFSQVLGKPVRFVDQPLDEFRARLRAMNLTPWRVEAVVMELTAIANGAIDHTTDTIRHLLGRPATPLAQFIADHRAVFAA